MWKTIKAPLRVVGLLTRIVSLLEEQNQLIRELHLHTTGHHAKATARPSPPTTVRRLTVADVWQRTSPTEIEQRQIMQRIREDLASRPLDGDAVAETPSSAPVPSSKP